MSAVCVCSCSALPLTTTEEAYAWLREKDGAFTQFVDIFQRRFLALFFRAWADSHPVAQNDRPNEDRFRAYIGSMIGVGAPAFRDIPKHHYGTPHGAVWVANRRAAVINGHFRAIAGKEEGVVSEAHHRPFP